MSLALARQAISSAHVAWASGDVVQCKLLAETAWEAAERAGDDDEAEAVKLGVAHFIMHAWTPSAMQVAMTAKSPKDRAMAIAFIRDAYASSAAWFESAAAKGALTDTATGQTVTPESVRAAAAHKLSEMAAAI